MRHQKGANNSRNSKCQSMARCQHPKFHIQIGSILAPFKGCHRVIPNRMPTPKIWLSFWHLFDIILELEKMRATSGANIQNLTVSLVTFWHNCGVNKSWCQIWYQHPIWHLVWHHFCIIQFIKSAELSAALFWILAVRLYWCLEKEQ